MTPTAPTPRKGYDAMTSAQLAHFHHLTAGEIGGYRDRLILIATQREEQTARYMAVASPEQVAIMADKLGITASTVLFSLS